MSRNRTEPDDFTPGPSPIAFSEAADSFLVFSQTSRKSFRQDRIYVKNLKAFFGSQPLESLDLHSVESYLNWRRQEARRHGRELAGATLNRDLACLRTIIRRAWLNRKIHQNSLEGLRLLKEAPRNKVLSHGEYERLLHHCPIHLKPLVELAYFTAMRKSELVGLKWQQVDLQNRIITLGMQDAKMREKREVPIDENLRIMFQKIRRIWGCPYVFTYRHKRLREIRTGFRTACRKAGLDRFQFRDLRFCAVFNMRKAGIPEDVIMSISGHKTHAVFGRYRLAGRKDRLEAMGKARNFHERNMLGKIMT